MMTMSDEISPDRLKPSDAIERLQSAQKASFCGGWLR
jgi:hypothetical protein